MFFFSDAVVNELSMRNAAMAKVVGTDVSLLHRHNVA